MRSLKNIKTSLFGLITLLSLLPASAFAQSGNTYEASVELKGYCKKLFTLGTDGIYTERVPFILAANKSKNCEAKLTVKERNSATNALTPAAGVTILSLSRNWLVGFDPNAEAPTYEISDFVKTDKRGRVDVTIEYNPFQCGLKLAVKSASLAQSSVSGTTQNLNLATQVLAKFKFARVATSAKPIHCAGEL